MKQVNAREFQKSFGRITGRLKAGETVQITKYGKIVGTFTKQRKKVDWDKFFKHLEKHSCPPEVGDELVRKFFNNEFLS
jgi:antitoxin (DNA-binding transcriptional repressor) of toxin-antitoxin stability system